MCWKMISIFGMFVEQEQLLYVSPDTIHVRSMAYTHGTYREDKYDDKQSRKLQQWDIDEGKTSNKPMHLKAGNLNLLVQALTSDKNLDNQFLKTFITTYRSFSTPWKLFSKLAER